MKRIGGIVATMKRLRMVMSYLVLLIYGTAALAYADEVLLALQQPLMLEGGTVLVIEDADPRQGKVWMEISGKNASHASAVLALGEKLRCAGMNLTLTRIYAGGKVDLVALDLDVNGSLDVNGFPDANESAQGVLNSQPVQMNNYSISGNVLKKSPGLPAVQTMLILAGYCLSSAVLSDRFR